MKQPINLPVVLVSILVFRCTTGVPDVAGTSEQGNARVIATVYTSTGDPAAGASVRLRPGSYLKEPGTAKKTSMDLVDTCTDADGVFVIDSVAGGSYMVEVTDNTREAVLLLCSVDTARTVELPDDTLRPFSSVKGRVVPGFTGGRRFVQVEGLERIAEVAADGSYAFTDLPAGEWTFRIAGTDASTGGTVITGIITRPAGITLVPSGGWLFSRQVVLNTTASGADVARDVYGFPVIIRLDRTNFDFREAQTDGSDIRFVKSGPDSLLLPFETECWDPVAGHAEIWVLVDTVRGNLTAPAFFMQWGNPSALPILSGQPVFDTANGFGGVWHLSGGSGRFEQDATRNGNPGTAVNVGTTDGVVGQAGAFNSDSRSYMTLRNTATGRLDFPADGRYSVSAWVNSDSITYNRVIISKGDIQYYLRIHNFNWRFSEYHDLPSQGWEYTESPYTFGKWVHLCAVRNNTSQYLYVNGVCVDSSKTFDDGEQPRSESFDVEIGRRLLPDGSDGLYFSGAIDEVRICGTARNGDWIRLCYMNQRTDDLLVRFGN